MLKLCAWGALSIHSLCWEDLRSGGQLCVDWLAACQTLDTPFPQRAFRAFRSASQRAAPVCCQGGWTLHQEGAVVAWAWGWGQHESGRLL